VSLVRIPFDRKPAARARIFLILGVGVALTVALIALSLRAPQVAMYAPTPAAPNDVGRALVGPIVYSVDATRPDVWRYFAFRLGSVIDHPGPRDWDLGFRRYEIIANGGREFVGSGGIADLGEVAFGDVTTVPPDGYRLTEGGANPRNPAIAGWYSYGYLSHMLSPRRRVWAVRTASGHYAKLEIISYYCPRSQPGCVTFRYVYQGDGSRNVARP
jgi:HmuY protein